MKVTKLLLLLAVFTTLITTTVRADEVTDWNRNLFEAARLNNPPTSPLVITRNAALVQAAVFWQFDWPWSGSFLIRLSQPTFWQNVTPHSPLSQMVTTTTLVNPLNVELPGVRLSRTLSGRGVSRMDLPQRRHPSWVV